MSDSGQIGPTPVGQISGQDLARQRLLYERGSGKPPPQGEVICSRTSAESTAAGGLSEPHAMERESRNGVATVHRRAVATPGELPCVGLRGLNPLSVG